MEQSFKTVAKLSDITPGRCRSIELNDFGLALFNVEGEIYALDNTCPHAGGPLGEGTLEDEVVTCPWHGWKFNVRSGKCLKNPSPGWTVQRYEARVTDGEIQVLVPSP